MRTRSIWLTIGSGVVAACRAALLASIAAPAQPALADTPVSGPIGINTTWTITNSPYIVDSNVTIASGAVLTIQSGALAVFLGSTCPSLVWASFPQPRWPAWPTLSLARPC
jgi:hypothetical protein